MGFTSYSCQKTHRLTCDNRQLNKNLVDQQWSLPNLESVTDLMTTNNVQYMSALDMLSGFMQLSIRPEDRHITSIVTQNRQVAFKRLNFWVKIAPALYCYAISTMFRMSIGKHTISYMDDLMTIELNFQSMISKNACNNKQPLHSIPTTDIGQI